MTNVRMPIETTKDGNKITKVCVEDVYKMLNRVQSAIEESYKGAQEVIDSVHKYYNGYAGELVIGTGISQPCLTDAFDEEIGNNIAFMKAKLNANFKKRNIVRKAFREYNKATETFVEELIKLNDLIRMDIIGIRQHNPEYLKDKNEV